MTIIKFPLNKFNVTIPDFFISNDETFCIEKFLKINLDKIEKKYEELSEKHDNYQSLLVDIFHQASSPAELVILFLLSCEELSTSDDEIEIENNPETVEQENLGD